MSLFSFLMRRRARPETGDVGTEVHANTVELQLMTSLSAALGRAEDPRGVAEALISEARAHFGVDFAAVALISEDGGEATGLVAHGPDGDVDWWRDLSLDLRTHPSGIASAAFEAAPLAVYDADHSPALRSELVAQAGAKSAAFIPLVSQGRVTAVLALATTTRQRAFSRDELALLQVLAGETALVLDRMRSSSALAEALERERLVAAIARRVRSELDLDAVLRVSVEETGRALDVGRCFIRLGEPGESMPVAAEWDAEGIEPIGDVADRLPASNLAVRERRTVAVADVATSRVLEDPSLGGRETLVDIGTHSVLATPILVFDRVIGVFGLHRPESKSWTAEEIALAEAVAREAGLAIHTAQLLEENRRRLEQQVALLQSARVVTAELELEAVLHRLVDEVARLLSADAADCYLIDPVRGTFRCAAVRGLPVSVVGFEFPVGDGLAAEAVARGRPIVSTEYGSVERPVQNPAYADFRGVIVAPVTWSGETRGVLGVGTKDPAREFSGADAVLLEAFASLASLALRNAESFEERSRQARIERGFYRIASVLGEPLSIERTVAAVAQAACDALGGDSAFVLTPREQGLGLAGSCALPDELAEAIDNDLVSATPVLGGSARDRRLLAAPSLRGDERFEAWDELAGRLGYHSLLAVPLSVPRTDEGGLVVVLFREQRELTDDDLDLAGHLAQAARGALERADLFETEQNARALSQQLAQSGSVVASELDPAAVLDEAVQRAPAMLGVDACVFAALEGDELVMVAATGRAAEGIVGARTPVSAKPSGDVLASANPVAIADAETVEGAHRGDPLLSAGFAAYLGVPVLTPEAEGVLAVYNRSPRIWRQEEIDALAALAGGVAGALANAELYQRVTQEKERSEAILANIADGIVAVDRDGKVVLWNAAAERISGVAAAEALGRRPVEVLQRNLESDGDVPGEDRFLSIARGSEEVWLSLTEAVMRDPAGAVSGRIFAFRDISAERVVEEMKKDFVSAVSHELRTPLTSIYGFAETMLRADVAFGEEERRTFLGYIASEAERLTRIVDTLLNVARLDSGDLAVHLAPTDVRSVVTEVVDAVEAVALNAHRFVVDLPEVPLDANADREKLRQVLDQLVDNAVRYSPEGGTVTISGRLVNGAVELEVADEGVGIAHAEHERIFRKFYRGEVSGRDGRLGGTGLGLFIAHGLVSAMGGRISVTSTEGAGSTFHCAIPAVEATQVPEKVS